MNRRKEDIEKIVDEHLGLFDSPSFEDVAGSRERTLDRLRVVAAASSPKQANSNSRHADRRWRISVAAAAILLAVVVGRAWLRTPTFAVVEGLDGAVSRLEPGETVRTGEGSGIMIQLADGSRIEVRSNS